ncbi:methyltransferase domain-containing protein [Streptomyces sp. NPDC048330]|uniref:methyltransferase domain-containing protein n=1 Tax=Streptomyces sp. NPDC048330 TaxID=3365533 RepID=UPI003711B78B
MLDIEMRAGEIWTLYGQHQLGRTFDLPELDGWAWDIPESGPGIDVFGNVAGLRVLDLGAGVGRHAARLAALGADVTAVDASPTQHQRALERYPDVPGLHLVCADAVEHLRQAAPYDLIYSVSGVPFLDPHRLLPALATGLKPGGRLLFTALHTNSAGAGPSDSVTARPEVLRLPGTDIEHQMHMWVLEPQLWEDLVVGHGLVMEMVTAIDSPQAGQPLAYRLYTARRPERVPSRPRTVPWETIGRLAELFTRLDTARGISAEQQWTLQVLKLTEEVGESAQAVIGTWATNPRKGRSHSWQHVQEEVGDTAITGLVSLHRMLGDEAPAFFEALLAQKAAKFLALDDEASAPPLEGA